IKTWLSATGAKLVTQILDSKGQLVMSDTAKTFFGKEADQNIKLLNPNPWSPETPYLYAGVS
uniref:hypothetical protein n=1 Tax=Pseudomonas viridiflava TaxID=33069 RepID=UPI0013CEC190